mgnify:CR=1 FL=1
MNILIAPDSFKGSLTALEVAESLERGLERASSQLEIKKLPMADGGEGTVRSLVDATNGQVIEKKVTGPLGGEVEAFYGILGDKKTGVIEMAAASGLPLVPEKKRNPLKTTTYGTGQLIKAALDQGCRKLIIGIGGSATNDCGIGMAQALGARFLDSSGKEVGLGGQVMRDIEEIDLTRLDERIKKTEIEVACDVDNPLYGKEGAAYIYAPQKGATQEQVEELDAGLRHFGRIIEEKLEIQVSDTPGAGAAGGLGAGLLAFLNAELKPGIDIVIQASGIREEVKSVDLVITGEGQLDSQTIHGKTPIGVAKVAKKYSKPVIGVAGSLGQGAEKVYNHGIDAIFSIVNSPMELEESLKRGGELLEKLGNNIGRILLIKDFWKKL